MNAMCFLIKSFLYIIDVGHNTNSIYIKPHNAFREYTCICNCLFSLKIEVLSSRNYQMYKLKIRKFKSKSSIKQFKTINAKIKTERNLNH